MTSRDGQRLFVGGVGIGVVLLVTAVVVLYAVENSKILFLVLVAAALFAPAVAKYLGSKRASHVNRE